MSGKRIYFMDEFSLGKIPLPLCSSIKLGTTGTINTHFDNYFKPFEFM